MQALVATAADPPEAFEEGNLAPLLIEAVGILISTTRAAFAFTEVLVEALQLHTAGPEGSLLLQLVYAALSIPAVCQVYQTLLLAVPRILPFFSRLYRLQFASQRVHIF